MFCKKCGSEISASDETCPKCGTFISDKFATEKYDPLLALDKVENMEDNVIWQEAPLDDDTIILSAEDLTKTSEPLIKEAKPAAYVEGSVQKVEQEEKHFKENIAQGVRAAKSTIANPIKPRKRIKPKESQKIETPNSNVNTQNQAVTVTESVEKVEEPVVVETPVVEEVP
ncbi:MAG TPA: zinc ribbon domain-containing protein, partial [Methanosphaera sp.]|nr:zinc ribbon domain-containing protein [Methanosphaera sp.]